MRPFAFRALAKKCSPHSRLQPARVARYIDTATQAIEYVDALQTPTLVVRSVVPKSSKCSDDAAIVATNATPIASFPSEEDADHMNAIWRDLLRDHPRHLFLEVPGPPVCGSTPETHTAMVACLPGMCYGCRLHVMSTLTPASTGPIDTWNILLNHILLSTS